MDAYCCKQARLKRKSAFLYLFSSSFLLGFFWGGGLQKSELIPYSFLITFAYGNPPPDAYFRLQFKDLQHSMSEG